MHLTGQEEEVGQGTGYNTEERGESDVRRGESDVRRGESDVRRRRVMYGGRGRRGKKVM